MGGCDGLGKRKSMSSVVGMMTSLFDTPEQLVKVLSSGSGTYKYQSIDTISIEASLTWRSLA